jgi:hypothetical protein
MPIYTYKHPKKEKYIELLQTMNEKHEFVDESGLQWERVFYPPNFSIDSRINPHDAQAFTRMTHSKKGTLGDLFEASKEMSERRGGAEGDPILQKKYQDFEKKTGKKHIEVKRVESKKRLKKLGVSVDL